MTSPPRPPRFGPNVSTSTPYFPHSHSGGGVSGGTSGAIAPTVPGAPGRQPRRPLSGWDPMRILSMLVPGLDGQRPATLETMEVIEVDPDLILSWSGATIEGVYVIGDLNLEIGDLVQVLCSPGKAVVMGSGTATGGGGGGITVVEHGTDGSVARPDSTVVYWVGTATPTNGLDYDFWLVL